MSVPAKFMEVARSKLDRETYASIYDRAVDLERKSMMQPSGEGIDKPVIAERIAAHLNGEDKPDKPTPHVVERIEKRMEVDVGPSDLGDLLRIVKEGGSNVEIVRQSMDLVQELVVNWRGKHFVVLYSKSRNKLITAYAKQKKKPKRKMLVGRPKDWRDEPLPPCVPGGCA